MDYRLSHIAPEKGMTYIESFEKLPYRKMVWKWEQETLSEIVDECFGNQSVHRYLDFACGTGRILGHLEDKVDEAIGVDLSESMIDVAQQNTKRSKFYLVDLTREEVFTSETFNLITAFRFFLNAQWDLKEEAMTHLANLLSASNGYLVFNVHANAGSLQDILWRIEAKIRRVPNKHKSLSQGEVQRLTEHADLQIVRMYHFGVIPIRKESDRIPYPLIYPIEKFFSHLRFVQRYSRYIIYICKRDNKHLHQN